MRKAKKKAKAGKPARRGRPRIELNAEQVEKLAQIGCTNEEIAYALDCSADTLVRNFADSVKRGRESAKRSLRAAQLKSALNGNATMMIWLGKQLLGQSDKFQHGGLGGGPIQHAHVDLTRLTDEQLAELERIIEAAHAETAQPGGNQG